MTGNGGTHTLTPTLSRRSSIDTNQVISFLQRNDPAYIDILQRAIEHEAAKKPDPYYLGWEWYNVQACPARLVKLVVNGIAKVNFKSNSTTCYLLVSREAAEQAIKAMK